MEDLKKVFAGKLLAIKAVKLQPNDPFTWASGWKSPFYCDNRQTLSYHDVRSFVKLGLTHAVLEHFPEADAVAGVATGAIAQGVLVADELALPYAYVRPKPKDHGMKVRAIFGADGREIEGLKDRLTGRFAAEAVVHPQTGEVMVGQNEFITEEKAKEICDANITRSPRSRQVLIINGVITPQPLTLPSITIFMQIKK